MIYARLRLLAGLSTTALLFSGAVARAQANPESQDQPEVGLEEIVVTAQKRSESVQDTPLSITALSDETLETRQINSVEGVLQATPNVQFSRSGASSRIAIRGLGFDNVTTGGEQRVAYHVDGVYFSRPSSIFGSFFDIERVEVLRGPQGTLYGRNATAGAINVITRDPTDEFSGYVALSYGSYDRKEAQGALSGALADGISARAAFDIVRRDGYGSNITNGLDVDDEKTEAFRGKIALRPSDAFSYIVSADYLHEDDHAYSSHFIGNGGISGTPAAPVTVISHGIRLGGEIPADPRDSSINAGPFARREVWGVSGRGELALGEIDLTSITAYRRTKFDTIGALTALGGGQTGATGLYTQFEHARQLSQEFRASYDGDWGRLLVGAYYLHESLTGRNNVPVNRIAVGAPVPGLVVMGASLGGSLKTDAGAVFAQADIELSDQLMLTLGGRYSVEKKSVFDEAQVDLVTPYEPGRPYNYTTRSDSNVWRSFNPKVTLTYEPRDGMLLYATYSTAFKSGGYNMGGLQPPFEPEELTNYEAGIKADWLDRRLRTNLSLFHYDYKDLQATVITSTTISIINAANSKVDGAELEIEAAPIEGLTIRAAGSLLDARYVEFTTTDPARPGFGALDLAGNPLSQSAKRSGSVSAEYAVPLADGSLTIWGESYWMGRVYFSPFKRDLISQPSYNLLNAGLRYEDENGWSLAFFGRNLTNNLYLVGAGISTGLVGSPATGFYGAPRTFGVEAKFNF